MNINVKRWTAAIALALSSGIFLAGCTGSQIEQNAKPIIKWVIPAAGGPAVAVCVKYCNNNGN
jgi:hypothetical protein